MTEARQAAADGVVIRVASLDDAPGILRVLEAAFERWPSFDLDPDVTPLEHLRWKLTCPGLTAAHTVAVVDGAIAAVTIRWVSRMRVGDEVFVQDSSVDHAVHPEMQGRGLGGAIARFANEQSKTYSDMSLGTGISHDAITTIFDRIDPPQVTHHLAMWSRPFGPRALLGVFGLEGGVATRSRVAARIARGWARRAARRRGAVEGVRIEALPAFDDRVEGLWEAFASRFEFATVRDRDFLNWRYCDRRGGSSVVLAAIEGERLLGYAVFKANEDWSTVLDLVVDPRDERAARIALELLDEGCTRMAAGGARGVNIGLSAGHPATPIVEAAGFLPLPWETLYTCGPQRRGRHTPAQERMYAGEARSHLVLGDSDIY